MRLLSLAFSVLLLVNASCTSGKDSGGETGRRRASSGGAGSSGSVSSAPPDAGVPTLPHCDGNADCRGGEVCRDQQCRTVCTDDTGCAEPFSHCGTQGVCVQCTSESHCGTNGVCNSGACQFYCREESACSGTEYCDEPTGQCRARGCNGNPDCEGGFRCDDFQCVPVDPPVCEPGVARCVSGNVERCNTDGTAVDTVTCTAEQVCESQGDGEASCVPRLCTPNALDCSDAHTARVCNGTGSQQTLLPCMDQQYCSQGVCFAQVCTPNAKTCDQARLLECNAEGSSSTVTDCDAQASCTADHGCTCSSGACAPRVCVPAARECVGANSVRECAPDGLSYLPLSTCPDACTAGICLSSTCTPGATQCSGATLVTCNAAGNGHTTSNCAATTGQTCLTTGSSSACGPTQCTPSAVTCDNAGTPARVVCDAFGHATRTPCDADQFCASGNCQDQVCEPLASTCASPGSVSRCNANGSATTVTACPSPQTCANGACQCTPQCGTRACGPDPVCGQSCGTCNGTCSAAGVCQPGTSTGQLQVKLTWSTNSGDLDVRLRRATDEACGPQECAYGNCKTGTSGVPPEWDGVTGRTSGDPVLDVDDLDGLGPEFISVGALQAGAYRVVVHFFSAGVGATSTTATLEIRKDGNLVATRTRAMGEHDYWEMDLAWGASPAVTDTRPLQKTGGGLALCPQDPTLDGGPPPVPDSGLPFPFGDGGFVCTPEQYIFCVAQGGTLNEACVCSVATPDAGTAPDAGPPPACNTLPLSTVTPTAVHATGSPPTMTGGTLVDGTYVATHAAVYGLDTATPAVASPEVWRFTGTRLDIAFEYEGGPPSEFRATYTVGTSASQMNFTRQCSNLDFSLDDVGYTVSGNQLIIRSDGLVNFLDPFTRITTFTRQ